MERPEPRSHRTTLPLAFNCVPLPRSHLIIRSSFVPCVIGSCQFYSTIIMSWVCINSLSAHKGGPAIVSVYERSTPTHYRILRTIINITNPPAKAAIDFANT
ncbi:hypothetical protein BJX76DRAFT_315358 [Aspergillus varians]